MAKVCTLPRGMEMYRDTIKKNAQWYVENGMIKATEREIRTLEKALADIFGNAAVQEVIGATGNEPTVYSITSTKKEVREVIKELREDAVADAMADRKNGNAVKPINRVAMLRRILEDLKTPDSPELGRKFAEADIKAALQEVLYGNAKKKFDRPGRARGELWIRQKMLEAVRSDDISRETFEFAEWLIKKNPDLVEDLAISVKQLDSGSSGTYRSMNRLMTLGKGSAKTDTAVHEMLHHVELLMPAKFRDAIREEYMRALVKKMTKNPDPNEKAYFEYLFEGTPASFKKALNLIVDRKVSEDLYQYFSASEFWAMNATELLAKRRAAENGGVFAQIKQWAVEVLAKIKAILGNKRDAVLFDALDDLFGAKGRKVSGDMLMGGAGFTFRVEAVPQAQSPINQAREAAERALAGYQYGGRTEKGTISVEKPRQLKSKFERAPFVNAIINGIAPMVSKGREWFAPLPQLLDKSYYGRAVKNLFLMQGALAKVVQDWASTKYNDKVLPLLKDKALFEAMDRAVMMVSSSAGTNMNDPKVQEQVRKMLGDLPLQMWFENPKNQRRGGETSFFEGILDQPEANEAIKKIFELATQNVNWEDGTVRVDYWRMDPETSEMVADRKQQKEGQGFGKANSEVYEVFTKLDAKQKAKLKEAVFEMFNINARLALVKSAAQMHSEQKYINQEISKALVIPHGLDMATMQGLLADIHFDYSTLKNDTQNPDRAKNFRMAIELMLKDGKYGNTGEKASPEAQQYLTQLRDLYNSLPSEQRAPFLSKMKTIFNKEDMMALERPIVDERLAHQIGGFYITQQREGDVKVVLRPVDEKGEYVTTDREEYGRYLVSVDKNVDHDALIKDMESQFKDQWFNVVNTEGELVKVRFKPEIVTEYVKDLAEGPGTLTLQQMFSALENAKVPLDANTKSKLIRANAKASSATLRTLMRQYQYGVDLNGQKKIMQHFNNSAFATSESWYGADIDELLTKNFPWTAKNLREQIRQVESVVKTLEQSNDPQASNRLIFEKERLANLKEGLAMHDDNDAAEVKRLVTNARAAIKQDIMGDQGDLGEFWDSARKWTAVTALGASVASFVTNIAGGIPGTISYLGGQTRKDGRKFGGGYGYGRASAAMMNAVRTLTGATGLDLFKKDLGEAAVRRYARSLPEDSAQRVVWDIVAEEMVQGRLQVGQALSILRIAHEGSGRFTKTKNDLLDIAMRPFTASETIIRIGTFVAAAQLEAEQRLAGGKTIAGMKDAEYQIFKDKLAEAGNDAVQNTQGVYEAWAKGAAMRSGISGTLTMFKTYPLVQLMLLKNMGAVPTMVYLAALWGLAGMDGEPLADDAKELYNILARLFPTTFAKYGPLGVDARKGTNELYKALERTTGIPAELVKHGALAYATGSDFTGSMGLGSLIPLKGFDGTQALTDSAGPVASFIFNGFNSGGELLSATGAALKGDTEIAQERLFAAAKAAPIRAVRNLTGAFDIADDGVASTRNGLAVVRGLDAWDAAMQGFGWRPVEGAAAYEKADIMKSVREIRIGMQQDINNLFTIAALEKRPELRREAMEMLRAANEALKEGGAPFRLNYDAAVIAKQVREGAKAIDERMAGKLPKDMRDFADEVRDEDNEGEE